MKVHRRYKGVGIYMQKEKVCGSDFKVKDDSSIVNSTPVYDKYYTLKDGSLKSESLDEIKYDIDKCIKAAIKRNIPEKTMVGVLNED